LDVRYVVAAPQGQGNAVVRGEERISIATAKAHVAVLLEKSLELIGCKVALGIRLSDSAPGQLHG
jgi:hypothetical protein